MRHKGHVEYFLEGDNIHESLVEQVNYFLKYVSNQEDVSVVVQIRQTFEEDKVCFKFRLGTRTWWKNRLTSAGFGPVIPSLNGLSARPLDKKRCGCMCTAAKSAKLPQSSKSLAQEFHLKLTESELRKLSYLREDGIAENMYNSCALVFSSGVLNLVSPPYGADIDAHDAVIRINAAPSGGEFSQVAGNKTTIRVMYVPVREQRARMPPNKTYDDGLSLQMLTVHFKDRVHTILEYDFERRGGVFVIPTKIRAAASFCLFHKFYESPLTNKPPHGPHLSQGMVSLLMSLHMCRRTIIFGKPFGISKENIDLIPRHYFEDVQAKHYAQVHGESDELRLLENLRDSGTISLVPDFTSLY